MLERFAIVGDPVSHSLSPVMQMAAFSAAGLSATYDKVRLEAPELDSWFTDMRQGAFRGCNVTLPYKQCVLEMLDELDAPAQTVAAVNTVVRRGETLYGYNTDIDGFRSCLRTMSLDLQGARVVVAGSGGAARAVLYVLHNEGAHITALSRDRGTSARLTDLDPQIQVLNANDTEAIGNALDGAALFINATPKGMAHLPNECAIPTGVELGPDVRVIDLIYGRQTPLLARAREARCLVMDGLEMLVQQGAAAFHLWTGIRADVDAMKTACVAALEEV